MPNFVAQPAESLDSLRSVRREQFQAVRRFTETICEPLEIEDFVIQSMPDVSPTRWHLAHTTWFFETFVLNSYDESYRSPNESFAYLFNSYYNGIGRQFPRGRRGVLSRPTVAEVWEYRKSVDRAVTAWLGSDAVTATALDVLEIGLHHEQQHQELILTDIKHVLSCNPLYPAYHQTDGPPEMIDQDRVGWDAQDAAMVEVGHGGEGFHFDNESPRHRLFSPAFRMQDRLVTNGEYLEFMEDGGYQRPELWLSLGWATVEQDRWQAPLYWHGQDSTWSEFTLAGLRPLASRQPVCHVSYFEADAYARWAGYRLPTEYEWERVAVRRSIEGNFAESMRFHPAAVTETSRHSGQYFGDVWEWTSSPYTAYPGYRPLAGALGEYNGKFMCNQFVLRGGSCATSATHIRPTYRNFFPPDARWQFSGIRLAE